MEIETVTIKSEYLDDAYVSEDTQIDIKDIPERINPDKPFRCGVCGHCTTSNVLLKVHMKMHLMKRVHQCNICKKSFSFVSELNNHMAQHQQEKFQQSLLKDTFGDDIQKANTQQHIDKSNKKYKNRNPNMPLSETEKLLLLQYIEKLGLNVKYKEMEHIKTFLRNGWLKMVEWFRENDYDRNADKLARTYFHMKNQAKVHIERFYVHKKLPRPRKVDYIFVKLCPGDFEGLGLDLRELLEDSKIYDSETYIKDEAVSLEDEEKHIDDIGLLQQESVEESDNPLSYSEPSTSIKRRNSEEGENEDLPTKNM